ncbi:RHS repeat-associated core domain-containing protein [Xanthomonas sp. A2111]|uniref:RHS repeat-associated core domain-containing protein n=2 Tax=Xanthomonas hawaiiensis TaxID=3003247 RepID=A0ABU2I4K1_9XANT|nr:RHS repeat-associated core domain-containing protein [Xanthomonas sp. A2111]MDS9993089.1 RHS repeat-associated core domain-containing protein [Xanthomonas sp. A2111]
MSLMAVAAFSVLIVFGASAQTVRYIHTDGLGSVVLITDKNRNVIERSEYEPFGRLLNRPIADGPGYTGHVMDASTRLTYMQQRYYDPLVARFLSADPVTANVSSGFNRYSYVLNNPGRYTDPDGRCERVTGSNICGGGAGSSISVIQVSSPSGGSSGASSSSSTPSSSIANSSTGNSQVSDSVVGDRDSSIVDLPEVVSVAYQGQYHDQLVGQLAAGMKAAGAQVVTELPICLGGGMCARIDIFGRAPTGDLFAIEVKTGLRPSFTPEQLAVYPHLSGGFTLTSTAQKISQVGLIPGAPLPPVQGVMLYQRDASSAPFTVPIP